MAAHYLTPQPIGRGFRLADFLWQVGALILPLLWGWAVREWVAAGGTLPTEPAAQALTHLLGPVAVALLCGALSGRRRVGIVSGVLTAVCTAAALKAGSVSADWGARAGLFVYPLVAGPVLAALAFAAARLRTRYCERVAH